MWLACKLCGKEMGNYMQDGAYMWWMWTDHGLLFLARMRVLMCTILVGLCKDELVGSSQRVFHIPLFKFIERECFCVMIL